MARPHETPHGRNRTVATSAALDAAPRLDPADPRAFGLAKAAYSVRETLELLSIGRTSLYAAVKRGELRNIKLGRRTLFLASDLTAFLTKLSREGEAR